MAAITPDRADLEERYRQRRERFEEITKGKSFRFKRRMERIERTVNVATDLPMVRVLPGEGPKDSRGPSFRKYMTHPLNNIEFPADHGSVEWPLDQFTLRRLRDGDVYLDPDHPHQQVHAVDLPHPPPPEPLDAKTQEAARRAYAAGGPRPPAGGSIGHSRVPPMPRPPRPAGPSQAHTPHAPNPGEPKVP